MEESFGRSIDEPLGEGPPLFVLYGPGTLI
jgi:hypothetical protein